MAANRGTMGSPSKVRVIPVIRQRGESDCGVAALAMLLGLRYEEALRYLRAVDPRVASGKRGTLVKELVEAARSVGEELHYYRKFDLDRHTGIISLRHEKYWHFAVLHAGSIIDPTDASIMAWRDHQAYYHENPVRYASLLSPDKIGG